VPPDLFGLEQNSEENREKRGAIGEPAANEKKDAPKQACISKERVCEMDQGTSVKLRPT